MSDVWKGVALPWNNTVIGTIEPKDDLEVIKSSVIWIVLTRLGERVMLPEFGSTLPDALFEPNDPSTVANIQSSVSEAISRWDDRVEFLQMETEINENTLTIRIQYKVTKDANEIAIQTAAIQLTPTAMGL